MLLIICDATYIVVNSGRVAADDAWSLKHHLILYWPLYTTVINMVSNSFTWKMSSVIWLYNDLVVAIIKGYQIVSHILLNN